MNEDGDGGGGDFALSVSPNTATTEIGTSVDVTVSVDRMGDVGDIMLSGKDLPTGITVEFATNPLTPSDVSSQATISVEPGAQPGTSEITLAGTAGGIERTDTLDLTAETITVSGKVENGVENITVVLVGKSAVSSDAMGNFTFEDVVPPYDLYTVAFDAFGTETVTYYEGLTRSDPVVSIPPGLPLFTLAKSANINGTLQGTGNTTDPFVVAWGDTSGKTTSADQDGLYVFEAKWSTTNSQSGTLYGLQWTEKSSGAPDTFVGYGETSATLTNGDAQNLSVTLAAPATALLTGTVSSPSGFPAPEVTLTQKLGENSHPLWVDTTESIDATIPVINGGTATLHATATMGDTVTEFVHPDLDADTDVSFDLPAPPLQSMPGDTATGVDHETTFQWTAPSMAVHAVFISSSTSGEAGANYRIITTASEATIPDVPELPLLSNGEFSWNINSFGPLSSTDEAATEEGLRNPATESTGSPHFRANSPSRTFTSAP